MAGVDSSRDDAAFPGPAPAVEEAEAALPLAAALLDASDLLWRTELKADENTEALDVTDADASAGDGVSVAVAVAADEADVELACFSLVVVGEAFLAVVALVLADGTMGSKVTLGINGKDTVARFPDSPLGSEKSPV